DVAAALVEAAIADDELRPELLLGGPEILTWLKVTEAYGHALGRRVRTVRQPAIVFRALSLLARPLSAAASQLLASQAVVATSDSAYSSADAQRLLGHAPISVAAFLRQRVDLPSHEPSSKSTAPRSVSGFEVSRSS